jgi:hypothetical protein
MVSAVKAVIAIGTFWMFSLRFCAVTTISSNASAKTGDPISCVAIAVAATPTANLQGRAYTGSIFPIIGFLDIPIPPMIF